MGPRDGGRAGAGDALSVNRRTKASGSHRHQKQSAIILVTADGHEVNERTVLLGSPFLEANPLLPALGPRCRVALRRAGNWNQTMAPPPPPAPIVSAGGGQPLALRRVGPGVILSSTTAVAA